MGIHTENGFSETAFRLCNQGSLLILRTVVELISGKTNE